MSTISCPKSSQAVYKPRRPEKTVLFDVIKKHYTTWQKHSKDPIPHYIDNGFRNYLECGILAKGFACAQCSDCNMSFLIAFSCKGRGLCPSCNTRQMVETAANLVENVIPMVPVRQWVISFPVRIRHYLQTHQVLQAVLRIIIDEIQKRLITLGRDLPQPKIGAVTFIHHFGNTLNFHPHFHIIVADGLFSNHNEDILFHSLTITPDDIAETEDCVRRRVLKYFGRKGWFDEETILKMESNKPSGFSLNANVQIPSWDREGLERLIRYCARPCFKSENLRWNGPWVHYRLPKPTHTGKTFIQLEPLEFIERISRFIPYPRRHRRHYHGVFAPNSPLRPKITANARKHPKPNKQAELQESVNKVEKVSLGWAKLIARIYEVNPLLCICGNEVKITAFVTHSAEIRRILSGIGWPMNVLEFDPPYEFPEREVCQLIPYTQDGFLPIEGDFPTRGESGPDPPFLDYELDPPHFDDYRDPPF